MLLNQSVGHEFAERLLERSAERSTEVRAWEPNGSRESAETAVGQAAERTQQLKLQIVQLRFVQQAKGLHPRMSVV